MDTKTLNDELERYLRPESFPLGIRMFEKEDLPAKVKIPRRDFGCEIAICQGISIGRRYGWTVAMEREDINCPLARVAFGFDKPVDFYTEGNLCFGMYTETKEAGRISEEAVPKFEYGRYGYIVAGPLNRIDYVPDVVVVYGNSGQVLRLLTAFLFKRGGSLTCSFTGRVDCADIVVKTTQTQMPQIILPCYGDRLFGQTQDQEMAFTFPWKFSEEIVEGLKGTHQGGIRYPIPSFLRYNPVFPPSYEKLMEIWKKGG